MLMIRRSRVAFCSGLLSAALAVASSAAAQDRAPAPITDAADAAATAAAVTAAAAAPAAQAAQPAQPAQEPKPVDGFQVGGFTFKPGGRVKLDVIRDFKRMGNEDSFDTRAIFIEDVDAKGTNSNLHAKETRLSLDIRGDVEGDQLRMYVEGDFYGASSVFRLRQAYGSYKWLLAGQTWSTFVDEDNFPRTIDFEAPTAFAQVRQAQLRVTGTFGRVIWSGAVEDNKSTITVPDGVPGRAEFPSPDLVTKVRFNLPRGHISTAAFVGAARFRPFDEDPDTVTLWGSMLSANFETVGRDTVYGVVTYGDGIGRHRGGTAAVPDENGDLHAVGVAAFMGGYEHFWATRWSTNGVYSVAEADSQPFYPDDFNRQLTYGAVNLLWWFLGDRGWMGVEYLYGRREVFGEEPRSGNAHRVQYAVRFNFP
jgi:hypothetical protein